MTETFLFRSIFDREGTCHFAREREGLGTIRLTSAKDTPLKVAFVESACREIPDTVILREVLDPARVPRTERFPAKPTIPPTTRTAQSRLLISGPAFRWLGSGMFQQTCRQWP